MDCMISLPGQLFYSTQIPACLWFLARSKKPRQRLARPARRDPVHRRAQARAHGRSDPQGVFRRGHRQNLRVTYHAWRREPDADAYEDVNPASARPRTLEEVREHNHVLTPGPLRRRVGGCGRRRTVRGAVRGIESRSLAGAVRRGRGKLSALIQAKLEEVDAKWL